MFGCIGFINLSLKVSLTSCSVSRRCVRNYLTNMQNGEITQYSKVEKMRKPPRRKYKISLTTGIVRHNREQRRRGKGES